MIQFQRKKDLNELLTDYRTNSISIGFVPTMGALHEGHLSLIEQSRKRCDITVCSIFINPTQFNNLQDFTKYPVVPVNDIRLLEQARNDILFIPPVPELYPYGTVDLETYPLGSLETLLEGRYRPGHFQGVCQVMYRLLDAIKPDRLFMGTKDYQQCLVVEKLLTIINSSAELVRVNTVREETGLAMSSRNMRLNEQQKETATIISKALNTIKQKLRPGPVSHIRDEAVNTISFEGMQIDYVEIARRKDLQPVSEWDGSEPLIALAAASIGDIRLIDNLPLTR